MNASRAWVYLPSYTVSPSLKDRSCLRNLSVSPTGNRALGTDAFKVGLVHTAGFSLLSDPLLGYFSLNPFMVRVTEHCQAGVRDPVGNFSQMRGGGVTDLFSRPSRLCGPLSSSGGLSTLRHHIREGIAYLTLELVTSFFLGNKGSDSYEKISLEIIFPGKEASGQPGRDT